MDISDLSRCCADSSRISELNCVVFSRVESTNAVGRDIAAGYLSQGVAVAPTVVLALEQSAGRGRLGRQWLSPAGGIYTSLIGSIEEARLRWLPLRVAAGLCRELDGITDTPCRLKWPNDLMVEGRKLGGILIETVRRGKDLSVVVGFGINYSSNVIEDVPGAISVRQGSSQPPSRGELARRLIAATAGALLATESPKCVVEEFSRWSLHENGDPIICRTPAGQSSGVFAGFDENGFLRLHTTEGERVISAGDLIEAMEAEQHVRP